MAPSGLAVIIGAGPATGAGMARVFADPEQGNMAVALLARRPEALTELAAGLRRDVPAGIFETFTADAASPGSIDAAFRDIAGHASFSDLKLRLAVYSVKHSSKKPFMDETYDAFTASLQTYAGGAFAFAQAALRRFFADHGDGQLPTGGDSDAKDTGTAATTRGTLIFTGTLGALRCSANFAAYGAGRAAVRQLAQSLAREMSARGVHVVHTVANGPIVDDGDAASGNAKMAAESVGRTYLWLAQQPPDLWTHELDMRPAAEKF